VLFNKVAGKDFVTLACVLLTQYSSVTFHTNKQTDRQTDRQTHAHLCHSQDTAFCVANYVDAVKMGYNSV